MLQHLLKISVYIVRHSLHHIYMHKLKPLIFFFKLVACDQNFTASYGVVSFKTNPSYFITECRYVIKAPPGHRIQLEVTNITTTYSNCYYGSLRLFEGANPDFVSDIPTATYCSTNIDRPTYLSQANALTVLLTRRSGYSFMYPTMHYRRVQGDLLYG